MIENYSEISKKIEDYLTKLVEDIHTGKVEIVEFKLNQDLNLDSQDFNYYAITRIIPEYITMKVIRYG